MRSITAALVVVAAVALAAAVIPAREAPARGEDVVPVLEPVTTITLGVIPSAFVATPNVLWATAGIEGVIRIDSQTGDIRARIDTGGAVIAALAEEGVWAVDVSNDRLLEIDRLSDQLDARFGSAGCQPEWQRRRADFG